MRQRPFTQAAVHFASSPILVGVAVILCLGLLAYRTVQLISAPSDSRDYETNLASRTESRINSLPVSQLAALNLFGEEKNSAAAAPPPEQDIPETRLKLVLQGVFTSSDNEISSALIATDRRDKAERYFLGDEVPGNAILHEVQRRYVVLQRGGRLEKLLFPREQGISGEPSRAVPETVRNKQPPRPGNDGDLKNRLRELRKQLNQNEEKLRI